MRRHERALYGRPFAPVAMLAVLAACASGPPPDQEIAAADLAVQAAHASTAGALRQTSCCSWETTAERAQSGMCPFKCYGCRGERSADRQ
jgi:hypothetical protein